MSSTDATKSAPAETGTRLQTGWRKWLRIHPAAEKLPRLSERDFAALVDDIRTHGLRQPVVTMNDGDGHLALLDGIHRLDALELLGREIAPNNHNIFGKPLPAMKDSGICALVRSLNLERRHVTNKEKRDLIAKLLKADPEKSNVQIAK